MRFLTNYGRCDIVSATMSRLCRSSAIFLALAFLFMVQPGPILAFWIWTPQKGKFENPSKATQKNAADQFALAKQLFDAQEYKDAVDEFEKVLKAFGRSPEATEAAYWKGVALEKQEKYYEAYESYEELLDLYPRTDKLYDVVEREFQIGNTFFNYEKKKIAGVTMPILPFLARDKALEIYGTVVYRAPFGPHAAEAHYRTGRLHMESDKHTQAVRAFDEVIREFPESEFAEGAGFYKGLVMFILAREQEYAPTRVGAALDEIEGFIERYPESEYTPRAQEMVLVLMENLAEEQFKIAAFYEKQKYLTSAELYYQDVIENFPATSWARIAQDKIEKLEKYNTSTE